jgi:hypothetical protein
MKSLLVSLALLASVSASAATAVPTDALFNRVGEQARELGYHSYSQIVCLDGGNNVVVGGATNWPMGTEIFLVGKKGEITATKRVTDRDEDKVLLFKVGANDVSLTFVSAVARKGLEQREAFLTVGPSEVAQKITCFSRISPLE